MKTIKFFNIIYLRIGKGVQVKKCSLNILPVGMYFKSVVLFMKIKPYV